MAKPRLSYPPGAAGGGGDSITINTTAVTDANFNDTTPAASAGRALVEWQRSGSGPDSVSAQTPASVPVVLDRTVTDSDVTNTTTETTVFTKTIPANAMSTNRVLHLIFIADYLNNNATSATLTIRIKFGGTTAWADSVDASAINASRRPFTLELWLANQNASNDQVGGGLIMLGAAAGATTGIGDFDTDEIESVTPFTTIDLAIDTTANQDLVVTAQWDVTQTTTSFKRRFAVLEII